MDEVGTIEYLILHHTERNNDFPFFIKSRHKYWRGWDDVGYHYMIGNTRPFTQDGKIYQGRLEGFEGAHTRGFNKNSLGICLIGNFDKKTPSSKQISSLLYLLQTKAHQYNIPIENIRGHRELPNTRKTCPGKLIDMDYIRDTLLVDFTL